MKHLGFLIAAVALLHVAAAQRIKVNFDPSVFRNGSADGISACSAGGPACDPTCRKTGICIGSENTFEFRETSDCGERYCDKTGSVASCSDILINCVPNIADHGCDTDGIFPDLYNCHNVINCKKGSVGTSERICDDDLSYDICTGVCDVSLTNTTCYPQTSICQHSGQFGRVRDNDRLYYYCVQDNDGQLHPVVGRCSRGYFDFDTFSCTTSDIPGCKNPNAVTTGAPPTQDPNLTSDLPSEPSIY